MKHFCQKLGLAALLTCGLSATSAGQNGPSALRFNTLQDDKVTVALPAPPTGPLTLEAWVYYDAPAFDSGYNTVLEFGNDAPWFGVTTGGVPTLFGSAQGGIMPVRTWSHLAYTWDGATSRLYLNGVQVDQSTSAPGRTGTNLGIGQNTGDNGWEGLIDEVMVWNTARTAAQIQADRNGGAAANSPGLLAYYKFNEGSGQTVTNQVAGGPAGVLGSSAASETNDPVWAAGITLSSRGSSAAPLALLQPAFPNPAAGTATIPFELHRPGHVQLAVLDLTGREVAWLLNDKRPAGSYALPFQTRHLAAGVYICRLSVDGQHFSQQLLIH